MKKIPLKYQPLLWSKNIEKLDLKQDKIYIIHQILSYGDLKELKWLFRIYDKKEIEEVFIKFPKKIYQSAVFYFIKNFVLGVKTKRLREKNYVKSLP